MRASPLNGYFVAGTGMDIPAGPLARVLPAAKPDSVRLSGKTAPKFGCRMMAYMNAEEQPGQDSLLRTCLLTGENSLRHQSTYRLPTLDKLGVMSYELMLAVKEASIKFPGQEIPMQADGWGTAVYTENSPEPVVTRSQKAASEGPEFTNAMTKAIAQKPYLMMAHLRSATVGEVNDANVHPFRFGNWMFMHNGGTMGPGTDAVRKQVAQYATLLGEGPKGQTDSETVFYYMLGKLQARYPDLGQLKAGLPDVPPDELHETFNSVVNEIAYGKHQSNPYKVATNAVARESGLVIENESRLDVSPATNYVLTNGKVLLAAAYGHKLHLGVRESAKADGTKHGTDQGNREVLLSSEPIQPQWWERLLLRRSAINWSEVQPGHSVMLVREPDGVKVTIKPFAS